MISVIIPAYNEGRVIARALKAMMTGALPNELDVIVVCNGCSDNTADLVKQFGNPVRLVETRKANKSLALNLGDEAADSFPRVYVDADVIIDLRSIRALVDRLSKGDVLAVAPTPFFDLRGCTWAVRAFYKVRRLLPSFNEGIGGSCVYALSADGHRRFSPFPDIVADDTFVRVHFAIDERETLKNATSVIFPPKTLRGLLSIETRSDYGLFELAQRYPNLWKNKGENNHRAIIGLFRNPKLWASLLTYGCIKIIARYEAKRALRSKTFVWNRDETSRAQQQ